MSLAKLGANDGVWQGESHVSQEPGFALEAGWYRDPVDPRSQRYWDGASWTPHVAPMLQQQTSTKALLALIIPFVFFPLAFISIFLGIRARREIDASNGAIGGREMATAGIWLGAVCTAVGGCFFFYGLFNLLTQT
jgi:hypothetical protein